MAKFIRWQEVKHMPRRRNPARVKEPVKRGVSLATLLKSAARFVDFKNARYVKPFKVERLLDAQGRTVFRAFTHTNDPRYPPERDHSVTIRPRDPKYKGKITECPAVITDCTCITGDMKVLTDKGWKTVLELCAPLANEFPINYVVDGKSYKGSNTFYTGKKEVFEIEMANGLKLKATGDHKVMVYAGKKVKRNYVNVGRPQQAGSLNHNASLWRITKGGVSSIVEDIKSWCKERGFGYSGAYSAARRGLPYRKDYIVENLGRQKREKALPIKYAFTDEPTKQFKWVKVKNLTTRHKLVPSENSFKERRVSRPDYRLGYLFGMIMGDGSIHNRDNSKPFLCLHKNDSEHILENLLKYGFVSSYTRKDAPERKLGYYILVSLTHAARKSFKEHRYINKRSVDITSRSMLVGYLAGLIDSDGSLSGGKLHKEGQAIKISGGHAYLKQLAYYMYQYGLSSFTMNLEREKGVETSFGVATRDMYGLYLNNDICRILRNYASLSPDRTPFIFTEKQKDRQPVVKIVSIKPAGKQKVYDLTVPDLGHFICEGVKISNCARHTFQYEYANAVRGDGLIWRGNGEPPNITNPKRIFGLCKHSIALSKWLFRRRI